VQTGFRSNAIEVGVKEGVGSLVAEGFGEADGSALGEAVAEGEADGVEVGVAVAVAVGVAEFAGVLVGVRVRVGVLLGPGVAVRAGVFAGACVAEGLAVEVALRVVVAVRLGLAVAVALPGVVGTTLGVRVGCGLEVAFTSGLGVTTTVTSTVCTLGAVVWRGGAVGPTGAGGSFFGVKVGTELGRAVGEGAKAKTSGEGVAEGPAWEACPSASFRASSVAFSPLWLPVVEAEAREGVAVGKRWATTWVAERGGKMTAMGRVTGTEFAQSSCSSRNGLRLGSGVGGLYSSASAALGASAGNIGPLSQRL